MSIRLVRQKDDEILRKKSKVVNEITDSTKLLIGDMKETMTYHGGCGLAAVQVGVLKKIIVCQPDEDKEPFVYINPEITDMSKETNIEQEGCLSVDGFRGKVERPSKIHVKAKDENMNDLDFDAEGFLARIICHEVDHLNGVLYTDKLVPGTLEDINEEGADD